MECKPEFSITTYLETLLDSINHSQHTYLNVAGFILDETNNLEYVYQPRTSNARNRGLDSRQLLFATVKNATELSYKITLTRLFGMDGVRISQKLKYFEISDQMWRLTTNSC